MTCRNPNHQHSWSRVYAFWWSSKNTRASSGAIRDQLCSEKSLSEYVTRLETYSRADRLRSIDMIDAPGQEFSNSHVLCPFHIPLSTMVLGANARVMNQTANMWGAFIPPLLSRMGRLSYSVSNSSRDARISSRVHGTSPIVVTSVIRLLRPTPTGTQGQRRQVRWRERNEAFTGCQRYTPVPVTR